MAGTTPAEDAYFEQLFGVSRSQLRDQGIDEDQFVREHLEEAMEKNGPASFRLRNRYYSWRFRTLVVFIALALVVAFVGGATGPLRDHLGARLGVISACVAVMLGDLGAHLRARSRYREAMRRDAESEAAQGPHPDTRGEFWSVDATVARYRLAARIPIPVASLARVTVHCGVLTVSRYNEKVLVQVDAGAVKVDTPRLFMGTGVKLDLGPKGKWVIGFYPQYGLLDDARSDTRHFVQAVQDAQSGWR